LVQACPHEIRIGNDQRPLGAQAVSDFTELPHRPFAKEQLLRAVKRPGGAHAGFSAKCVKGDEFATPI
jgi:hypothetical protein